MLLQGEQVYLYRQKSASTELHRPSQPGLQFMKTVARAQYRANVAGSACVDIFFHTSGDNHPYLSSSSACSEMRTSLLGFGMEHRSSSTMSRTVTGRSASTMASLGLGRSSPPRLKPLFWFIGSRTLTFWPKERLSLLIIYLLLQTWLGSQLRRWSGYSQCLQEQLECVLWIMWWLLIRGSTISTESKRGLGPVKWLRAPRTAHFF